MALAKTINRIKEYHEVGKTRKAEKDIIIV
jgi:hypothetical protein